MTANLTAEQLRAARAMLRITQEELAVVSGLTPKIIQRVEGSRGVLGNRRRAVINCLVAAFANAGVEFTEGRGVRLREADQ
jgi:transcriptional regulator with XRE-family HTH domain